MRNVGLGLIVLFMVGCSAGGAMPHAGAPVAEGSRSAAAPGAYADAPAGAPAPEPAAEAAGGSMDAAPVAGAAGPSMATSPAAPPPPPPPAAGPMAVAKAESPVASRPTLEVPAQRPPAGGQLSAGVWDDNRNFDFWMSYASRFRERDQDFAMFSEREMAGASRLLAPTAPRTELDVQLVLDTTGSMGDELAYLQGEFDAIAARLHQKFPQVKPRWSLVVYRDKGDQYVTRHFDFTTDAIEFRRALRVQSAGGGGDTPEAVVDGLAAGLRQSWRKGANVAKLAFWVADAPAHHGEGPALAGVIRDAKAKGVHLYPIASSDSNDSAEYQMRSAAQMTGGRYLFLTNDSGIGNSHAEPHIPCYNVTRLDHAIVRMIGVELSGRHVEAESNEVIRSVGRPNQEGKCQLSSGQPVIAY
ncbi:MAG: VWA domain-containing protein [Polyangiaceae bacterium]|nr:VWA domain-containing protein [Polyangiaceae bacterium]